MITIIIVFILFYFFFLPKITKKFLVLCVMVEIPKLFLEYFLTN